MSYEAWRISHGLGLIAVAILATWHAVTVGRHGVYNLWFDVMWITLCAVAVSTVAYTYFVRPVLQQRRPFKIVGLQKEGSSDWGLTIEKDGDFDFDFDGGQFVWINTSGNPYNRKEHPFSIASSPASLPKVEFLIRAAGDYTSNLDQLKPGQRVFVDGPHGAFTSDWPQSRRCGVDRRWLRYRRSARHPAANAGYGRFTSGTSRLWQPRCRAIRFPGRDRSDG